jgi:putative phosphoribosyl transferase
MSYAYADRIAAGQALAGHLRGYAGRADVTVLGLARGGVVVARPVAVALGAPLDVLVVRKLGLPWAPEVAFGAISSLGVEVRDEHGVTRDEAEAVTAAEWAEAARQEKVYRLGRPPPDLRGRTVIVVDDGLATGATATVGLATARAAGAGRVVLAVPVGAPEAVALVGRDADEVVCPVRPPGFGAVSEWYLDFAQVSDDEVRRALG